MIKTAPVIDVSFDNNSAKNGNYYKADRTATIKITEHNFNSGSQYVNIPVTAEGTTAPSVVGWSGSGDDHNATVSFNKDGKYSFTVDYTDLAGNKADSKKVDSVLYQTKPLPKLKSQVLQIIRLITARLLLLLHTGTITLPMITILNLQESILTARVMILLSLITIPTATA